MVSCRMGAVELAGSNESYEEWMLFGSGGHALVLLGLVGEQGRSKVTVYDDDVKLHGRSVYGVRISGPIPCPEQTAGRNGFIGIGLNRYRKEIDLRHKKTVWLSLIHEMAWRDPSVAIGDGTVLMAGAICQPGVALGRHVIVNTGATIDHDCIIGDYAHVCPGAHLAGNVLVGEGALIGTGAVLIPGVKIGREAVIGAGAVVVKDVQDAQIVKGVPAR